MKKLVNLAIALAVVTAASTSFAKVAPASANCNKQSSAGLFQKTAFVPEKNTQKKTTQGSQKGTT